jgi:Predicted nucleotidyltransferases
MILFGSYARGDFNGFSDVDLIVVDHNRNEAERLACSIQLQGLADDVLTLSSVEWNKKKKSDSFFWKSILQESICLYEHS